MICPFCGETVSDDTKFCPECGFPFETEVRVPNQSAASKNQNEFSTTPVKRSKKPLLIILIIAIILIAGGVAGFYLMTQSGAQNLPSDETPAQNPEQNPLPAPTAEPIQTPSISDLRTELTILSSPSGADVTVGGENRGKTPVTIPLVPYTSYAVFVELDGYDTKYTTVTLERGEQLVTEAILQKSAPTPVPTLSAEGNSIEGFWSSVEMVPDDKGEEYFLSYQFLEDGTGQEFWYKNGKVISCPHFTWIKTGKKEYILYYDGFKRQETFTMLNSGKRITDSFGNVYSRTSELGPQDFISRSDKTTYSADELIPLHYVWQAQGSVWEYAMKLPKEKYEYYSDLPRYRGNFLLYATDGYNRELTKQIASDMLSYVGKNLTPDQMANVVIAFAHSIPYVSDEQSTGLLEYYKYPIETLVDGCGDCEDLSILTACILRDMGIDVVLILFDDHMGIGIAMEEVDDSDGEKAFWEYKGKKYYYLETTSPNCDIGDLPDVLKGKDVKVIYFE